MASGGCENNVIDTDFVDLSEIIDATVDGVESRGAAVVEGACGGDADAGDRRRTEEDHTSQIDRDESGSGDAEQQEFSHDKQETPKENSLCQKIAAATDVLRRAAESEKNSHITESFQLYKQGIEILLSASKEKDIEKKRNLKTQLNLRIQDFSIKAEHLKDKIQRERAADMETLKRREYLAGFIQDPNEKVDKSSVVGQEGAVNYLMEHLVVPFKFPKLFEGCRTLSDLLVFGHPGTGKTMALKACASMIPDVTFFKLSIYDLMTKYAPEEGRNVIELFRMASERNFCVIIIEDFERIFHSENRLSGIYTELMVQMESRLDFKCRTMVVCVTQTPWHLKSQLRRRLEKRVCFQLPSKKNRINILKAHLEKINHKLTEEDFDKIGNRTAPVGGTHFTQADIVVLSRDIMMQRIVRIQNAKYFSKTETEEYWVPCHQDDEGAVEMNWMDVDAKKLLEPAIEMSDVLLSLADTKGTVDSEEESNMFEWRSTFTEI